MTGIEKVIYKPLSDDEERYSITRKEADYLYQRCEKTPYDLIWRAFRYGFEKGRRCEQNAQKRAKKAPVSPTKETTDANDTTANGCQGHCTTAPGGMQEEAQE